MGRAYDSALERLAARAPWQRYRAAVARSRELWRSYPLVLGICAEALLERPARVGGQRRMSSAASLRATRRRTVAGRTPRRQAERGPRPLRRADAARLAAPDGTSAGELAARAPTVTRLTGADAVPTNVQPLRGALQWPPADLGMPAADAARLPFGEGPVPEAVAPGAGELALVVSPVEGFRGLIQVQDALARVPGVDTAHVEAFARGDARVVLGVREQIDPAELSNELGRLLGRAASVAAGWTPGRELKIALG